MARTPDPKGGESKVTAFLVTPDMPGFEVVEARMPKCGIRGTATARLAFHDMPVPAANILGPLGKGLKVALTVLDFGRTTFGASCTGAAKTCLAAAARHAARRRQFGRPLADLELIKKKLAFLAAIAYAMEATTYETAALIDRGAEDYMLETAILKVFSTEMLWQGVYETLQIHGGQGYFTDEPYERMMRDARINTIGEGANEVLKAFIALVGMRDIGEGFKATLEGLKSPSRFVPTLWRFGRERLVRLARPPAIPVASATAPPRRRRAGTPRRTVRLGGRAGPGQASRGDPRATVRPGADRRRRDRAGDRLVHPRPARPRPGRADRLGARPHRRRALPADGQPPVRPGAPATSTTTTTARPLRPPRPPCVIRLMSAIVPATGSRPE